MEDANNNPSKGETMTTSTKIEVLETLTTAELVELEQHLVDMAGDIKPNETKRFEHCCRRWHAVAGVLARRRR